MSAKKIKFEISHVMHNLNIFCCSLLLTFAISIITSNQKSVMLKAKFLAEVKETVYNHEKISYLLLIKFGFSEPGPGHSRLKPVSKFVYVQGMEMAPAVTVS